jgi:hypothetical protein
MTRQIPYLHAHRMADGRTSWHWKPSPRLRKANWTNLSLGITEGKRASAEIVAKAVARNDALGQWEQGAAAVAGAQPPPRKWRFSDLVCAYRQSAEFTDELAAASRSEYEVRLRQLEYWAEDGNLPIRDIDRQLVQDLKDALLASDGDGKPGSKFVCSATLRVLRLLMNWAVARQLLDRDPTIGVKIPTPPSRTAKLDWLAIDDAAQRSIEAGDPLAARYLRIGFWSLQRHSDLIERCNRMAWRTFENLDPRDRPALANDRGEVKGFRIQQRKTGRWVDCPLPAWMHPEIEQAFERSQYLFPQAKEPSRPLNQKTMQTRVRRCLDAAGYPDHQGRDLRRSGMSWMEDMGALRSDICSISGHMVLGRRTTLDTYMPPDTRGACAAVAAAERMRRARATLAGQEIGS